MKLVGLTFTYNEENMIPYVMPYVERMGYDKFIVYDNESTDNTVELLKKYSFVEVRTYNTNNTFNNQERIKIAYNVYCEVCKLCKCGEKNEELGWFTITDFDEVLFVATKFSKNVKDFLDYRYCVFGENYFNETMINLFPKMNSHCDLLKNKYVHLADDILCGYWNVYGKKTTMFVVNDFPYWETCVGFHWSKFKVRNGRKPKSLSNNGEVHGFHLKYIDKELLYKKHEMYRKRQDGYANTLDFIYESLYTTAFPLSLHFYGLPMRYDLDGSFDSGVYFIE